MIHLLLDTVNIKLKAEWGAKKKKRLTRAQTCAGATHAEATAAPLGMNAKLHQERF